jgi:voltage-gated potassium channel
MGDGMQILSNIQFFGREVYELVKSPTFIMLTIIGNGMIGLSGALFYYMEKGINHKLLHFIDAIWWAFSTATTTGYGDITPVTTHGKILGILLMLMGTALFAMYTGLFAEIILTNTRRKR